jgi:hypothetical protein
MLQGEMCWQKAVVVVQRQKKKKKESNLDFRLVPAEPKLPCY